MKFRTEIFPENPGFTIAYPDSLMFMGSCFTENIGAKFRYYLFKTRINPFGIVYNPISLKQSLDIILSKTYLTEKNLSYGNKLWYSFYHHSSFSGPEKGATLDRINTEIEAAYHFLKKASFLFISFGTAWVYRLKETGKIVNNCHKLPSQEFERELTSPDTITDNWTQLLNRLTETNPNLKVIFTISPVRHWKDGAHGNNLSKSILHLATQNILDRNESICSYFPSYELIIDDLRDYRFYASDLLHPSEEGIQYIWEKLSQSWFDKETLIHMKRVEKMLKSLDHKLLNPTSETSARFLADRQNNLESLKKELPFLNWSLIENDLPKKH